MNKKTRSLIAIAMSAVFFQACSDDPKPSNEEELITEVGLTFIKLDESNNPTGDPITFSWTDIDGEIGDEEPVIDAIELVANSKYEMSIELKNGSVTPAEDITTEVEEEGEAHQFFFAISAPFNDHVTFTYDDEDDNGKPIGLKSIVDTGTSGSGTLTLTLRHKPKKSASGVASGDITNAGGETDIAVEFPISSGS